jgi:hypothetical protein
VLSLVKILVRVRGLGTLEFSHDSIKMGGVDTFTFIQKLVCMLMVFRCSSRCTVSEECLTSLYMSWLSCIFYRDRQPA